MTRNPRSRDAGQALVEFALALTVFIMLLLAIFDFGRGIYMYNGVSEAAREVARAASVDQGISAYSPSAQQVIDTQKALIPGLTVLNWKCVASSAANDNSGASGRRCNTDEYIVVTARATYQPVSLLGFLGTINLEAKSRIQVPLAQQK